MGGNGGFIAAVAGVLTLIVVASIAYQVLTDKNSVPLVTAIGSAGNATVTTLFK
jgi:hypothetical protein